MTALCNRRWCTGMPWSFQNLPRACSACADQVTSMEYMFGGMPYVMVEKGRTCSDEKRRYILTEEECEAASKALGLPDTNAEYNGDTQAPLGCYIRRTRDLYVGYRGDKDAAGPYEDNYDRLQICGAVPNTEYVGDDLSAWDVSSVTSMRGMFQNLFKFRGTGLGNWSVSKVTDVDHMLGLNENYPGRGDFVLLPYHDESQCRHADGTFDGDCCAGAKLTAGPGYCEGGGQIQWTGNACGERDSWCKSNGGCEHYECAGKPLIHPCTVACWG